MTGHAFCVGEEYQVEPSLNSVTGPAGTIRVEPKAMQVLVCLAEHAGEVVAKEQLIRTVWSDTFVSDDVLTRCISDLRRVLGDDARDPRVIQTIPKSGYRLIAGLSSNAEQDLSRGQTLQGSVPAVAQATRHKLVIVLVGVVLLTGVARRWMVDRFDAPRIGWTAASAHPGATHREPA